MDKESIKLELTRILTSIFGNDIKKTIDEYYESNKLQELVELSKKMLSDYMGEENAAKLLGKIVDKELAMEVKND